jgi:hypothetical protein
MASTFSTTPREKLATDDRNGDDGEIARTIAEIDVDDDIAAIIPMPKTIPAAVRTAITDAFMRLSDGEDLDRWLHEAHELLGGASPFERIVSGDGTAVLEVLMKLCTTPNAAVSHSLPLEIRIQSATMRGRHRRAG